MVEKELDRFFEDYLEKDPLFINKRVLQANYTPDSIFHREVQIQQIAKILAPSLRLQKPSNVFVYGKTGTGKTVCINSTTNHILKVAKEKNIPIKVCYLNCKLKKVADTEYRLIAEIARQFGKEIPVTGLPTEEVYNIFHRAVNEKEQLVILILDEIDQLVKKIGDEILYNLTRMNSELDKSQLSIIGISNDLIFADNLDPRVKSSLSEEELIFPPYNALQIQDILKERAKAAFRPNCVSNGVIEKCAAFAAREHGDARRALELLRVSGELAERECVQKIGMEHIDKAEEKIERDRVMDIVSTQPKQFQVTLYAILTIHSTGKDMIFTGEVYEVYKNLCSEVGIQPLTQRRLSDIVAELDMQGIITARVISKGRYGRTREISLAIPNSALPKIKTALDNALDFNEKTA